jgi:hypothetical protein
MHHAGTFAQHLYRTRASATRTQNIRIEDGARGAGKIPAGYFLDKARHIDMRRTSPSARRIETVKATICLRNCSLPVEWRMQVAKALDNLRLPRNLLMKWSSFAH